MAYQHQALMTAGSSFLKMATRSVLAPWERPALGYYSTAQRCLDPGNQVQIQDERDGKCVYP